MVAVLIAVPAMSRSSPGAMRYLLLFAVAVVVPMGVLMFSQVRRGRWTNVDASRPSERPLMFVVALAGVAAALGWILFTDPRSFLVRGLLAVAGFLVVAALLTRWVKLSLHVAFAALTATTLCLLGFTAGYALIPVVALVFWSRLVLQRHEMLELLVGLLLGGLAGVALVRI